MGTSISRRDLVKGSAAAAALALGGAGTAFADEPQGNRVCEILGIEKPVVQALMNELTSPELAAAVSNAGGLGIIALPTADDIDATKALTDKPFGVATYFYDDDTIEMYKEHGVEIVAFCGSLDPAAHYFPNAEGISRFKEAGFTVLVKVYNATLDRMLEYEQLGADILMVIGYGAGGCGPSIDASIMSLLAEYKPQVKAPMIAAGGIVNAETAAAAALLGAEGAYVGTRFLVCDESPCSEAAQQEILNARVEDLIEIISTTGRIRVTRTPMSEHCIEMYRSGATLEEIDEYCGVMMPLWASMRDGNIDEYAVGMDNAVNMITERKSAQQIVDEIASGFGF